jgi:hypothetical protein
MYRASSAKIKKWSVLQSSSPHTVRRPSATMDAGCLATLTTTIDRQRLL